MRRDINWLEVDFCSYDVSEYHKNIPVLILTKRFLHLNKISDSLFESRIYRDGQTNSIFVDTKENKIYLDEEYLDPERFVLYMIGDEKDEIDPTVFIKQITGVDIDDFICEVWYQGGYSKKFDVKKTMNKLLQNN